MQKEEKVSFVRSILIQMNVLLLGLWLPSVSATLRLGWPAFRRRKSGRFARNRLARAALPKKPGFDGSAEQGGVADPLLGLWASKEPLRSLLKGCPRPRNPEGRG